MAKYSRDKTIINNDFYEELKEDWYTAEDHPIALLRAENAVRAPWVDKQIKNHFGKPMRVLDIGCGAGFLSNFLAMQGHHVTGIDLSKSSLEVAKKHDSTRKTHYLCADAYQLPFDGASFDVVCAMDILEHVDRPEQLIHEAARVLKPNGQFYFHTFNRTFLSYLIVIKGVDWFVRNAPKNMHVYDLFISPEELKRLCTKENLQIASLSGFVPQVGTKAFWNMLFKGTIQSDFCFKFVKSLSTGYCGFALKKNGSN